MHGCAGGGRTGRVERLRDSDSKRVELSGYDIDRRVACRLDELGRDHGEVSDADTVRITVALSQEELGAYGASREAVAHSMQRLRGRDSSLPLAAAVRSLTHRARCPR